MVNIEATYFQKRLLKWHVEKNNRVLPWKEEKDVYKIWLSEIILQQTRAEQGWKYYERFVATYPTVKDLAKAPLDEVYKLWEGLGYYNRCRNLHATAQKIVTKLEGKFPNTYEQILELKGIGPYTAAAIASFAYNLPYAVVDGNVFRVLSRFFGINEPIDTTQGKKTFAQLAQQCLAPKKAAVYNQAIMDFGASVCKPENPLCTTCMLQRKCLAFAKKMVAQLPVKEKQLKQRSRWFVFFVVEHKGAFAVQQRTQKDVWQHLYQFPLMEFYSETEWKKFAKSKTILKDQSLFKGKKAQLVAITKPVVQKLSHQTIYAMAVALSVETFEKTLTETEWKTTTALKKIPFPKVIHQLIDGKLLELFPRAEN